MEPMPQGDGYVSLNNINDTKKLFTHGINFCNKCGHVQTNTDVDQRFIYDKYIWTTGISPGLKDSYRLYVNDLVDRFFPTKKGLAVEIGSNDGTFSKELQSRGFSVLGVEPAANLSERANESGVETLCEFFDQDLSKKIVNTRGAADLIVANHVFANINNNDEFTKGVKYLLSDDGIFSLQVFYLYDVMRSFLLENFNHEHPSYMYVGTLVKFFENYGLELFDVERVSTKGGSIRCFVQQKGGVRTVSKSVDEFINKELEMGLHKPQTYASMSNHIVETRRSLAAILAPYRQAGNTIAAYGTSIGATVFTYQYDLGGYLDFFVDDDASRHGLFSPGFGIPVKAPSALYEERPALTVITAPLYAEMIIGKHQTYVEQGGKFLVFRPKIEILG
jgi:hypothetical protein